MNWKEIVIKETREADLDNIMNLWNNGEVMQFVGYPQGLGITRIELDRWLAERFATPSRVHYSIYLSGGRYCGETHYRLLGDTGTAAMDIKLMPTAQGKGIAGRALAFAINQAFLRGGAARVYVEPSPANAAAWRLYERLGFLPKTRPAYLEPWPTYLEITRREWQAGRLSKKTTNDFHVEICHGDITLRDYLPSDIANDIRWQTTETEWQLWDAPWEMEKSLADFNATDFRARMEESLTNHRSKEIMRTSFELCTADGIHIGGVNSYLMNDDYEWISSKTHTTGHRAIGIDICEKAYWSKGYGSQAYRAFIDYLFVHGLPALYTQTWSGNTRMIGLAKKLGFELCACKRDKRLVRGSYYDGLTFKLERR